MFNIKKLLKEGIKNPKKIINLIGLRVSEKFKPQHMFFYPSFIAIEPTISCNLRCIMCQIDSLKRDKRELNFNDFKRIIDQIPSLRVIDLQGIGEPFLNKDFFKMAEYADLKNIKIYTFSNGNLIDKKLAQKIADSNLKELIISIDGAKKETYEKIRRNANFEKLISNLKYLFSIRDHKNLKITAWIVPNKYNFDELEDIVKLCNDLGFDKIVLQSKLTLFSYKSEVYDKNKKLSINNIERFKIILNKLQKNYKNLEICTGKNLSANNQCKWPWSSVFISSDGNVVPCCVVSDPKIVSFGNILKEDFKRIWNCSSYKIFRKNIKSNKIPAYCTDCYNNI